MSGEAPTWVLLPQVRQALGASWLCVADVHAATGNKCMKSTGTGSSHGSFNVWRGAHLGASWLCVADVHACNSQDKIWPPTVDNAAT